MRIYQVIQCTGEWEDYYGSIYFLQLRTTQGVLLWTKGAMHGTDITR